MSSITEFIANPDKDETVIVHTATFDGLLDHNAELRATRQFGGKEMRHVANIPGIVIEQYCLRIGITWREFHQDPKHIKAICNDPDLAYFRVAPGKV